MTKKKEEEMIGVPGIACKILDLLEVEVRIPWIHFWDLVTRSISTYFFLISPSRFTVMTMSPKQYNSPSFSNCCYLLFQFSVFENRFYDSSSLSHCTFRPFALEVVR